MHRDMSYDLDATFATRGMGELQRVTTTKTKLARTPGLRVMTQPEQHAAAAAAMQQRTRAVPISAPAMYKVIESKGLYKPQHNGPGYTSLQSPLGRASTDMAGLGDITLFGHQVSLAHVAIGAGVAFLAWHLLGHHRKRHHAA